MSGGLPSEVTRQGHATSLEDPEDNIVPTVLEIHTNQRDAKIRAVPSLPKGIRDDDTVRAELRDSEGTILWHSELRVDQARERLTGASGHMTFRIPATVLKAGMCTVNLSDGRSVPFFRATVEIVKVD
jgi:hypothetical protein